MPLLIEWEGSVIRMIRESEDLLTLTFLMNSSWIESSVMLNPSIYAKRHKQSWRTIAMPLCQNRNLIFGTLLVICSTVTAVASTVQKKVATGVATQQNAILLVAFGSSAESGKRAFENIEKQVAQEFPNKKVYWAYTSQMIRKKLKKQGEILNSVPEALAQINSDSISTVAIQSLHVVPGEEYTQLANQVKEYQREFPSHFSNLTLGQPLLNNFEDMTSVSDVLINELPSDRKSDEAVLWLGHGHHHGVCDLNYVAMESGLQQRDPLTFVALVEGGIIYSDVLKKLKTSGTKTVWLSPMMVVSGVHVIEDLVGETDSWKSQLIADGFTVKEHLPGMGELDGIANVFVDHIKMSMGVH